MVIVPVEPPITEYLYRKAAPKKIPLSGTFELTPVCNMACRMCYVRMSREQQEAIRPLRTPEEWLSLASTAKEQGMLYLLLTGGEPFLRKDFREILTGLHKMGLVISINSNGTLIDEETVAWLKETPPVRINITLYGASNETYARLCGNPQGFTQVTRAIRMLKEAGISVKLNCSVTPYNVNDLDDIFAYVKEEQLIVQATTYMFPPVRRDAAMTGQNDRFSPEDAAYYAARVEALMNGREAFLTRAEHLEFAGLPSDGEESCTDIEGEGIRCRAGKCSFWVTWDGRLLPCGMLAEQGVDVFQTGFVDAWKMVTEQTSCIRLPAKCKNCSIKERCKACAAMAVTESGQYDQVPEYRCRMAHAYTTAAQKVAEELKGVVEHE